MSETEMIPPEFEHFSEYKGPPQEGFFIDFLGARTRISYFDKTHDWLSGRVFPYPTPTACILFEYFEWIGALRSVLEAKYRLTIVELGAGWAPWLVSLRLAGRQRGIYNVHLIAVEAEQQQCRFAQQHLSDNGVAKHEWTILCDNVGIQPNDLSIAKIIKDCSCVDLIHCDIQGAEADAFEASMPDVSSRVRRVVVGTHGRGIEDRLFSIFGGNSWKLEFESPCRNIIVNGAPQLQTDGVQVWRNPRTPI